MTDQIEGLPRSYFYRRIAGALHEVIARNTTGEDQQPKMADRVNIQEALSRLIYCPVCGSRLQTFSGYPQERTCEHGHGEFVATSVYTDGDVVFEFTMVASQRVQDDVEQQVDDRRGDSSLSGSDESSNAAG